MPVREAAERTKSSGRDGVRSRETLSWPFAAARDDEPRRQPCSVRFVPPADDPVAAAALAWAIRLAAVAMSGI